MRTTQIPLWKVALGGFLAGLTGGILMLTSAAFLRTYLGSPSSTELIFDRSFPLVTVDFFIEQINRFGGYVPLKIAGVVASLSGQLLAAAFAGLVYAIILEAVQRLRNDSQRRWIDPLGWKLVLGGLLVVWIGFLIFLWPTLGTQYFGVPSAIAPFLTSLGLLIDFGVCAAGILVLYGYLTHRPQFVQESAPTLRNRVGVPTLWCRQHRESTSQNSRTESSRRKSRWVNQQSYAALLLAGIAVSKKWN